MNNLKSYDAGLISPDEFLSTSQTKSQRGKLLDFGNGGANVLIWGLTFGIGDIIWGLKIRGPKWACFKSEIWGRPDYLGSDVSMSSNTYF